MGKQPMSSPAQAFVAEDDQVGACEDPGEHIRVGSFYEIDHSRLPSENPELLQAIRVVMVNEKTRMKVSIRFPSVHSLQSYFSEEAPSLTACNTQSEKKLPLLDETYIMGSEAAAQLLYRRIPLLELAGSSCSWLFWVAPSERPLDYSSPLSYDQLKEAGMLKGANRRRVRLLIRQNDGNEEVSNIIPVYRSSSSDHVNGDAKEEENRIRNAAERERMDDRKRKGNVASSTSCNTQNKRKHQELSVAESGDKEKQIVDHKRRSNDSVLCHRWPAERRYKLAEEKLSTIMKQERAVFGNAISRHELREKARKVIGDTGLLDHLLKHVAGKVAPGGEERFKRGQYGSVGGAMEYWLDKADLDDVRNAAGVKDPPGDPNQHAACARKLMQLKEEMAQIIKSTELLISSKHEKERLAVVEKDGLLFRLQEKHGCVEKRMERIEDQLMGISQSVRMMQDGIEKLKRTVVEGQTRLAEASAEDKAVKTENGASKPRGTSSPETLLSQHHPLSPPPQQNNPVTTLP